MDHDDPATWFDFTIRAEAISLPPDSKKQTPNPLNMKNPHLSCPRKRDGFSLVEILVVVVIVAILASVALTVGPKMTARAKATEALENMRQIGPFLTNYAIDHSNKFPAINGPVKLPDGTERDMQWNEVCLMMAYPDVAPSEFSKPQWWKTNTKVFLRNPLLKEDGSATGWKPLNPGYGMNEMIAENLAISMGNAAPSQEELLKIELPMTSLAEPARTPLLAPSDKYHFRYDPGEINRFNSGNLKDLLSEGKFPIIFVDNHVEQVTPGEYVSRKLYLVPITPTE